MTDQQSARTLDGDGRRGASASGPSVVMTTVLARRRRHLHVCHRCVFCAGLSWLLLTHLVIDCVQGVYVLRISTQIILVPHVHCENKVRLSAFIINIARRILSVRLSVCLSVTRVHCDKTVERSVQIYIPYERTFIPLF